MTPDYLSKDFLKTHLQSVIDYYHPACLDLERGGYFCQFGDDQSILDRDSKHLVSTNRFIFNYCLSSLALAKPEYRDCARHGLDYLETYHKRPEGGYAWIMNGQQVQDGGKRCYGHAFVLLALAAAHQAGLPGMGGKIEAAYDLLEQRFWRAQDGLYVDEYSQDWSILSPYRGQNANMHVCEAMLLAHEATGAVKYLDRAHQVASRVTRDLAALAGGLIFEHYTQAWQPDWNYHQDEPNDYWRPYGYTTGHQTEWAKLLLILERHRPEAWILPQAEHLFNTTLSKSWDEAKGGMIFTLDPAGKPVVEDRRHWVLNETITAAGLLAVRTGQQKYRDWYQRLWAWSDAHMVDHERGGWYLILQPNNTRYDLRTEPQPRDFYHPQSMCFELLRSLP